MGSKRRLAKDLEHIILERATINDKTVYVEPFVGGMGSFERLAPHFHTAVGADLNKDLILMWDALINGGWEPPTEMTKSEYDALKASDTPSALRAFAGFGCSFGGKWFCGLAHGGYRSNGEPRNHVAESARNLLKTRDKLAGTHCRFFTGSYSDVLSDISCDPQLQGEGSVFYLDPPYANTGGYKDGAFNSNKFWGWATDLSHSGAQVFASEYNAPDNWVPIFERELIQTVKNGKTQRPKGVERIWVEKDSGLV